MSHPELLLYHFESCPYCKRVRDFLASEQIVIPMKDVKLDPHARVAMYQATNKTQVPCLFIDGTPLFESAAIIQWFKDNWK